MELLALGELININKLFISIPLPSSADNHQLKNADYASKGFGFLIEEKDVNYKLFDIKSIYADNSLIKKILASQRQYSDKNTFKNIESHLERIVNEKINLGQKDLIHFVGIGGIGMSGLAQIMKNMGFKVQEVIKVKIKIL